MASLGTSLTQIKIFYAHERWQLSSHRLSGARVQCPAPSFAGQAVVDKSFKEIKLEDFKGKYLVLYFYPLDFTFVCPTEIIAFSDRIQEFKDINCEVVGVSTDSHFSHLAWINMPRKQGGLGELKYPLLADFNKKIASDYGSVDETLRLVKAFQFVEKHGEVCPAGWTPDSPTIKPSPNGSKDYFEKVNEIKPVRSFTFYHSNCYHIS
ncbi:PRDX3 [Lepeophtheirus salmonis]|uniref:thioredoxin-dependent peroxiredoxin n=1 Tax=Lepeophtheirus salmonis TaxID=72036 RepID=A0A7R8D840_LEPSM|nr:PRDX3 [Lepeophtheirus salmonis]CAF3005426.1 PRDX3 [Lepeophtheirus salmonis]